MELLLIRHAQPEWVRDGVAYNDPGLTELGHRQARAVADRFRTDRTPPTELLVSSAVRAQETAGPLAEVVDPTPETHDWLFEIRLPDSWDGTPAEQIREQFTSARWRPRHEFWDGIPDGGESFRDFHARITSGLESMLADWGVRRHEDDPDNLWHVPDDVRRIILVAHAGTNSTILCHLLGVEPQPWEWERFSTAHASVTHLVTVPISRGHIFSLRRMSDVAHLAADDVTR